MCGDPSDVALTDQARAGHRDPDGCHARSCWCGSYPTIMSHATGEKER
jgi:hypothetical protein